MVSDSDFRILSWGVAGLVVDGFWVQGFSGFKFQSQT